MTVGESLRKNAHFLLSGLVSAVAILLLMRWLDGAPLFQPQSDFGILLGVVLVAGFVVFRDMRGSEADRASAEPRSASDSFGFAAFLRKTGIHLFARRSNGKQSS